MCEDCDIKFGGDGQKSKVDHEVDLRFVRDTQKAVVMMGLGDGRDDD